ncbi:MAG: flagellar basal-body MS-ring/collar protein FliF [Candidatus Caenarcaniphilales bacterium]|nr:flagellar basal-body MS-ring/collar protein FliF [Candidatus Caenarcaniphilales bacterium]
MAAAGAPQQPNNAQFAPVLQNRPLQIAIGVGLLILIVAGVIFFSINASKDKGPYEPLVQGVEQARALEIAAELNSKGIETEIVPTDTGGVAINVRKKQMDNAVLEMARSNLLSTDDFKLFDKTDWAASDYEKRVKYMRAVGGELSRLISRMDGIRWAKAHVTIPPEKLFTSRYIKDKTSASVTVETDPGRTLNRDQVSSILSLVSGYVPEIEPGRVSIIDTKGQVYSSATSGAEDGGVVGTGGFDWAGKSSVVNSTIESRIQSYLDGVLGPGKSRVAVSTVLTTKKTTQNITKFSPGAIGTHEYSEEALGDGAKGAPYTGNEMNSMAPPPRPVDEYGRGSWQSNDTEMVDPRLRKDMPREFYEKQQFKDNAFKDPRGHSYNPCTGGSNDGPMCYENTGRDPSIQPNPNSQAQGLYSMGSQNFAGKGQQGYLNPNYQNTQANNMGAAPTADARYVCAAGDEACMRNYRRHNFAIQSYPSYEQTMIESPAGAVSQIRVSVAVEKGSLPVSVSKLKAGIAAAADPNMLPSEVEVILTPSKAKKEETKKQNGVFLMGKDSGGFQWWWIPALILVIILVFLVFRAIGSLLVGKPKTFRDRVPFPAPAPSPNNRQNNPLDRLDFGNQTPVFRDDLPPQQPPNQPPRAPESNIPARPQNQPSPRFDEDIPSSPTNQPTNQRQQDLPFDLDDEFSATNPPPPQPRQESAPNQPQVRQQRQRPKVVIEDNNN